VEGNLRTLHEAGATISLDDFGTGYASLSYFKRFSIDALKIGQQFVQSVSKISLAGDLSMDMVTEEVETRDRHRPLQSMGCRTAQGFLYSPAVPADQARRMVSEAIQWHPGRWGGPFSRDGRRRTNVSVHCWPDTSRIEPSQRPEQIEAILALSKVKNESAA
jgi:predicted signal transduction protein with EAL and GGDEF domain